MRVGSMMGCKTNPGTCCWPGRRRCCSQAAADWRRTHRDQVGPGRPAAGVGQGWIVRDVIPVSLGITRCKTEFLPSILVGERDILYLYFAGLDTHMMLRKGLYQVGKQMNLFNSHILEIWAVCLQFKNWADIFIRFTILKCIVLWF